MHHGYCEARAGLQALNISVKSASSTSPLIEKVRASGNRFPDISDVSHRNRHEIEAIGGAAYLCSLTELLPRRLSIESYVRIVKEKSRRRALITLCHSTTTMAEDQSIDIDEILGTTDTRLLQISADQCGC
jgi:replicative DNA helicase